MNNQGRPEYQPNRGSVGPFNFAPEVQAGYSFPQPLTIYDSTLRKIIATSGVRPSVDDMLHVADAIAEVGVKEVLYNISWWGGSDPNYLEFDLGRAVLARNFSFHTSIFSDSFRYGTGGRTREAMDRLAAIGMKTMIVPTIDVPASERARQFEHLHATVAYAKELGIEVTLAFVDAGRLDFENVVLQTNEAIGLGARRLDLLDSRGSLSPDAMKFFIAKIRSRLAAPIPITLHIHDDYGLASATAIAAATAGAHPDVAVNGMSYRAGFAALEEVVVALELLYGVPTGLKLEKLKRLSEIVAERSGFPVPPLKPIVGAHAFIRDMPNWVLPLLKDGLEQFPPIGSSIAANLVGARMGIVWGIRHPSHLVRAKLQQMGLAASDEQVTEIVRRFEERLDALKRYPIWLTDEEFEKLCRDVVPASKKS